MTTVKITSEVISDPEERPQIAAADRTGFEFVALRTSPVRFKTDPSVIAVPAKRRDLTGPVETHFAERSPRRLVIAHVTVLRVNVDDAVGGQLRVPVRKGLLTHDERVGRIPDRLQCRVVDRRKQTARLLAGGDVARVF